MNQGRVEEYDKSTGCRSEAVRSLLVEMWAGIMTEKKGKAKKVRRQETEHGLTSHFSRISGQFLRISRRVYNAGGAVSSARPLIISHQIKRFHRPGPKSATGTRQNDSTENKNVRNEEVRRMKD